MTVQKRKKPQVSQLRKPLSGYSKGGDLNFYRRNHVVMSIVMDQIKEDLGGEPSDEDCEVELRRLCEPSVRHYCDCNCAICR